jgi:Zn-dependent peptidase ImmA (M78 family)
MFARSPLPPDVRDTLLADVARWLADYGEVERLVDERVEWTLPEVTTIATAWGGHVSGRTGAKYAAARARRYLGLAGRDREALVRDMAGLLESKGVKVMTTEVAVESFFGLAVGVEDGGPAIVANVRGGRISAERWIFTLAHALGHLLLHANSHEVAAIDKPDAEEWEADIFAGDFLVPDASFKVEWNRARAHEFVDRVREMRRIFGVSWQTVIRRLAAEYPEAERRTIWPRMCRIYRRRHGSSFTPPTVSDYPALRLVDSVADERARRIDFELRQGRLFRLVRIAVEQEKMSVDRAAEILGLEPTAMWELANSWNG